MRRRIGSLQVPRPALEVVSKLEILPSVSPLEERETRLGNERKKNSNRGEHERRAGRQTGILSWAGEIKPLEEVALSMLPGKWPKVSLTWWGFLSRIHPQSQQWG